LNIITILDPVWSQCSNIHAIKDCLKYSGERIVHGPYSIKKIPTESFLCKHDKRVEKGLFLTGLLPRVLEYCSRKGFSCEVDGRGIEKIKFSKPSLPGITFRDDQYDLILDVRRELRGVVKSPTGSGKTVLAGAIISMLPASKIVFTLHTESIFSQTIKEFQNWFGEEEVGWVGDDQFNVRRITVLMVQSVDSLLSEKARKKRVPKPKDIPEDETEKQREKRLKKEKQNEKQNKKNREKSAKKKKINKEILLDLLTDADALIIDECHHLGEEKGRYVSLLKNCLSPIRVGLSATPQKEGKKMLVCEGYLGPIIGEFTMEEGIKQGILAKPKVKLIPVPINPAISALRKYQDQYRYGIIENKARNRLIAREIHLQNKAGKSVLVTVLDVEHGHAEMIQKIAKDVYGIDVEFVYGATDKKDRDVLKSRLESKDTMAAISTTVWFEGTNIKSLDVVVMGHGGKSDIMTEQAPGRGLRTTELKKDLLIVDFLDPYSYLAQHAIQRLRIYTEKGWL